MLWLFQLTFIERIKMGPRNLLILIIVKLGAKIFKTMLQF